MEPKINKLIITRRIVLALGIAATLSLTGCLTGIDPLSLSSSTVSDSGGSPYTITGSVSLPASAGASLSKSVQKVSLASEAGAGLTCTLHDAATWTALETAETDADGNYSLTHEGSSYATPSLLCVKCADSAGTVALLDCARSTFTADSATETRGEMNAEKTLASYDALKKLGCSPDTACADNSDFDINCFRSLKESTYDNCKNNTTWAGVQDSVCNTWLSAISYMTAREAPPAEKQPLEWVGEIKNDEVAAEYMGDVCDKFAQLNTASDSATCQSSFSAWQGKDLDVSNVYYQNYAYTPTAVPLNLASGKAASSADTSCAYVSESEYRDTVSGYLASFTNDEFDAITADADMMRVGIDMINNCRQDAGIASKMSQLPGIYSGFMAQMSGSGSAKDNYASALCVMLSELGDDEAAAIEARDETEKRTESRNNGSANYLMIDEFGADAIIDSEDLASFMQDCSYYVVSSYGLFPSIRACGGTDQANYVSGYKAEAKDSSHDFDKRIRAGGSGVFELTYQVDGGATTSVTQDTSAYAVGGYYAADTDMSNQVNTYLTDIFFPSGKNIIWAYTRNSGDETSALSYQFISWTPDSSGIGTFEGNVMLWDQETDKFYGADAHYSPVTDVSASITVDEYSSDRWHGTFTATTLRGAEWNARTRYAITGEFDLQPTYAFETRYESLDLSGGPGVCNDSFVEAAAPGPPNTACPAILDQTTCDNTYSQNISTEVYFNCSWNAGSCDVATHCLRRDSQM